MGLCQLWDSTACWDKPCSISISLMGWIWFDASSNNWGSSNSSLGEISMVTLYVSLSGFDILGPPKCYKFNQPKWLKFQLLYTLKSTNMAKQMRNQVINMINIPSLGGFIVDTRTTHFWWCPAARICSATSGAAPANRSPIHAWRRKPKAACGCPKGSFWCYPLVNCHITMENHHF